MGFGPNRWSRLQSKLFSSNSPRQILPWNVTIHAYYQYQKMKSCESHICLQTKLRVECTNEMFMCIQLHRTSHLNILTKMQSCQRVCQAQIKISIKCYSFMIQNDAIATVLFGRARVIIFCLYKGFRTHSKLNCALGDAFFFNSLEAILKRTWQLHCTLQKVQEIVHVILNCIVSWSNFQIIAEWCWRFWSYSNDQPARFWFASAYDFHSLLINEIFNLFTFLFLIRDICIFSNILLQRPPSPWLNICMSEWP